MVALRCRLLETPFPLVVSSMSSSARSPRSRPERANGSPFATINALSLGRLARARRRWVMFCFFGGGLGGNPEGDGLNHGNNPISTATIPPVEILESRLSGHVHAMGAAARQRQGRAIIAAGSARSTRSRRWPKSGADVFLLGERGKFPPFGVNGGEPAALNRFVYETDAGEATPPLASKMTDVKSRRGQRVRLETPGGGGFGDPADARSRARRPRRAARLRVARGGATRLQGRAVAMTARSTPPHRQARAGTWHERRRHRRRRRRRHVHRPVPARCGSGQLPHRQGAVAPRRRVAGLPQRAAARSAAPPASDSIVHGTTVGTNTLLERRGRRSASSPRAAFATCWRCAAATGRRTWGLWGDFVPIADRDMRLEVDERTLADGTVRTAVDAGEVRAAATASAASGRAGPRHHLHQRLRQCRTTSAGRWRAARAVWPNEYVTASQRGAVRDPRVRALLDDGAQRLSAAGGRRPISASSSRAGDAEVSPASCTSCSRTAASCRRRPRAGCRCAPRCPGPAAGVVAGAALAKAAGFDNVITCDLGGTSFDVSLIAGGKVVARGADHDRFRPRHPHADDRDHHHRRRRRLDRLGRSRRPAAGRPGKRRLGAGAGLLRRRATRGRR